MALVLRREMHDDDAGKAGGVGQAAAGSTVAERNLDRVTVACAVCFFFTSVILAIRLQ